MKTIWRSLEVERWYIIGVVRWELHFWQIFNYCVAAVSQNTLVVKCPPKEGDNCAEKMDWSIAAMLFFIFYGGSSVCRRRNAIV